MGESEIALAVRRAIKYLLVGTYGTCSTVVARTAAELPNCWLLAQRWLRGWPVARVLVATNHPATAVAS